MSTRKESVLQALDLAGYKHNLYSVKDSYADKLLEYYRMQANRVNADYFYCFNNLRSWVPAGMNKYKWEARELPW